MSEAIIRTLRGDDYPALIDLVCRTWYAEFDERTGLLAAEADWENCLARTTNAFVAGLWTVCRHTNLCSSLPVFARRRAHHAGSGTDPSYK